MLQGTWDFEFNYNKMLKNSRFSTDSMSIWKRDQIHHIEFTMPHSVGNGQEKTLILKILQSEKFDLVFEDGCVAPVL